MPKRPLEAEREPTRFTERYKRHLYVPSLVHLTDQQMSKTWNGFLRDYFNNGIVSHFRMLTVNGFVRNERAAYEGIKKESEKAKRYGSVLAAEELGKDKGEYAFLHALHLAYELHAMGRHPSEVAAALAAEMPNTTKGKRPAIETEPKAEATKKALGRMYYYGDIADQLRFIRERPDVQVNVQKMFGKGSAERSAAFIRMTQLALDIQQQNSESRHAAFDRALSQFPQKARQDLPKMARTYSYMLKYYYNINPGLEKAGHELGEFSAYAENPAAYREIAMARAMRVASQQEKMPEIKKALSYEAKKLGWTITEKPQLLHEAQGNNTLVLLERRQAKGIMEIVDKMFARPAKYVDFEKLYGVLSKDETDAGKKAFNEFKPLFKEAKQKELQARENEPASRLNETLGRRMTDKHIDLWYDIEKALRPNPQLASVLRTENLDDIIGLRLVALINSSDAYRFFESELLRPQAGTGKISQNAAQAIKQERDRVRQFTIDIAGALKQHKFRNDAIGVNYDPRQNRIGVKGHDSRLIGPAGHAEPVPLTIEEIRKMEHYSAGHLEVSVKGTPLELQVTHVIDHLNANANLPGFVAIGYGTERLARIPGMQMDAKISGEKLLKAYNGVQHSLLMMKREGRTEPTEMMREVERTISKVTGTK